VFATASTLKSTGLRTAGALRSSSGTSASFSPLLIRTRPSSHAGSVSVCGAHGDDRCASPDRCPRGARRPPRSSGRRRALAGGSRGQVRTCTADAARRFMIRLKRAYEQVERSDGYPSSSNGCGRAGCARPMPTSTTGSRTSRRARSFGDGSATIRAGSRSFASVTSGSCMRSRRVRHSPSSRTERRAEPSRSSTRRMTKRTTMRSCSHGSSNAGSHAGGASPHVIHASFMHDHD
jgi:hypothetical protein